MPDTIAHKLNDLTGLRATNHRHPPSPSSQPLNRNLLGVVAHHGIPVRSESCLIDTCRLEA